MVEVSCLHEEGCTSSSNEGPDNNNKKGESRNGSRNITSVVVKALCVAGGFFFMRKLTKSTAPVRVDHSRIVAEALSGEKFSSEQAARDPTTYFNLRMLACPAMEMVNGSKLLYFEQAFRRTPEKPYRQVLIKRRCELIWRHAWNLIMICCWIETRDRLCLLVDENPLEDDQFRWCDIHPSWYLLISTQEITWC